MKTLSTFWFLSCLAALGATEDNLNRRFTADPGGTLAVEVDFGSIEVATHSSGEVVVDVWRKITRRNASDEEAFLREHPVELTQNGSTITIRCRAKGISGSASSWSLLGMLIGGRNNQNEAKYTIKVPERFNASLKTAGGAVEVAGLTGDTKANTSGGALRFSHLRGPLIGSTAGGSVHVIDCQGALDVHTSGGGIDVAQGAGSLTGTTSGGAIAVKEFHGPAHVETSGGSITIENVTGRLDGSTSGGSISAVLPGPLADSVDLSTAGGSVTVRLPETSAFDLDAETSGGGVSSELPVTTTGKLDRNRLKGPVNGGGKPVVLRTSGGSIHVRRL